MFLLLLFGLALSACGAGSQTGQEGMNAGEQGILEYEMGRMMGEEEMNGMEMRHNLKIPEAYAGLSSPIKNTDASLARGKIIYQAKCVVCHGEYGMGDGAGGASLYPKPAPIAMSSQMLGDDYLFWRISEGGIDLGTAMPAWKAILDEGYRWDVI
ncbi:MAG: cytochrome c, partial [Anaerolineae bacterium]|nr:cytochrome c [Anaerolineae bacterium]